MPARVRRCLGRSVAALTAAAAVGAAAYLWPTSLGGSETATVVSGRSMLPHLETGDLVLARHASTPSVGDVVVFRPDGLEATVIHRIVRREPDGAFLTQGDNNPTPDPWRIDTTEILGVQQARIPHVGGLVLSKLLWLSLLTIGLAAAVAPGPGRRSEMPRSPASPPGR